MTERRRWKAEEKLAIIKGVKENEKLKKLLAEKDLENALLSDALKKRW